MRKQYHFRNSEKGLLAWDVDRLVELASDLIPVEVPLSEIRELDKAFWYGREEDRATCRSVALHAKLILEADLSYPVILSSDGRVMDGMHRICKALIKGSESVTALRFTQDPEPDYTNIHPDELSYNDEQED